MMNWQKTSNWYDRSDLSLQSSARAAWLIQVSGASAHSEIMQNIICISVAIGQMIVLSILHQQTLGYQKIAVGGKVEGQCREGIARVAVVPHEDLDLRRYGCIARANTKPGQRTCASTRYVC